ncbi:hypothetical protein BC629DRAFT_351099 [Irpex lacteus]|nr:hypothetical protein BC629DRAFT_351099 [Irpex lacteus]
MPGPRIFSTWGFSYEQFLRHSPKELCEIWGGFVISLEEATRWANRILTEKQKQDPSIKLVEHGSDIMKTLNEVVQGAGGMRVMLYGNGHISAKVFSSQYFIVADIKVAHATYNGEEHVLTEEQKDFDAEVQERMERLLSAEGVNHGGFEVYAMSLSERTQARFFDLILQALPANGISMLSLDNDHSTISISPEPVK